MEFADKPNFTVAGVTDWTAVGGHGSDATLRTSEALARETLTLKPDGSGRTTTMDRSVPQHDADLHRQLGELDEKMGDPLAAVHEDEQAVRLDPSEQNYFAWGSELLLHRAVWQAAEVFRNGSKALSAFGQNADCPGHRSLCRLLSTTRRPPVSAPLRT